MDERYGFKPEFLHGTPSPDSNSGGNFSYSSMPNTIPSVPPHNSADYLNNIITPYYPTVMPNTNPYSPGIPVDFTNTNNNTAFKWVNTVSDIVPNSALWAGEDIDGHAIYVGRAHYEGDWIPAKVIPGKNIAYICYNGKEIPVHDFQILCERRLEWLSCFGSNIPPHAVNGGRTSDGEPLYIGRVRHENSLTVGKVHPSHGVCYIPFDGQEIPYNSYEILTLKE